MYNRALTDHASCFTIITPGLVSFGGLATIEDDLQSAQTWYHYLSLIKLNTKNSVSKIPETLGRPSDH